MLFPRCTIPDMWKTQKVDGKKTRNAKEEKKIFLLFLLKRKERNRESEGEYYFLEIPQEKREFHLKPNRGINVLTNVILKIN